MRIAVGADHAGFPLKNQVIELLKQDGCRFWIWGRIVQILWITPTTEKRGEPVVS